MFWTTTIQNSTAFQQNYPAKKATLLTGRYVEINLLPLQFAEYNDFIRVKSPNLPNNETLANFIHYGGVPEYIKQLQIGEKQAIKDSNSQYLLTTDNDFNPVYDGIRKLNVIDWMLQS